MSSVTTFLVQAFNNDKGGQLKANAPVAFRSADGARRTPEKLSLNNLGIVAFSATSDSETGDYDDQPTVCFRGCRLRPEFDAMPQ